MHSEAAADVAIVLFSAARAREWPRSLYKYVILAECNGLSLFSTSF